MSSWFGEVRPGPVDPEHLQTAAYLRFVAMMPNAAFWALVDDDKSEFWRVVDCPHNVELLATVYNLRKMFGTWREPEKKRTRGRFCFKVLSMIDEEQTAMKSAGNDERNG